MPEELIAEPAVDEPRFSIGGSEGYKIARTYPDAIMRHDISDEQLTLLVSGNRSFQSDVMWAALGTAGGSLVPALSAIASLHKTGADFGYWELAECGIFFSALVVCILMITIVKREPISAAELARAIRVRTAREIGG